MSTKPGRSYEKRFEVAAPLEAVWKALTEGEELTRWFCQRASSEPGVGGKTEFDWGGGAKGTHVTTVWEKNAHLRTEAVRRDLPQSGTGEPYAVDWYLEHEGGVTRVRMVASGFGEGPEWDHEYDGTFHGWDLFHKTLKHYLEHHRGQAPANFVLYAVLPVPPAEAWTRLWSPEGLLKKGNVGGLAVGAPFRFETIRGDLLEGVVTNYVAGKTFAAMVENLNKAMLNLELFTAPGRGHFLYLSLNTWGLPRVDVDALGARLESIMYGLFPQKAGEPIAACAAEPAQVGEQTT